MGGVIHGPERQFFGLWRSLVARLHGVQEAVGSNPASPTNPLNLVDDGDFPALFCGGGLGFLKG